jgi:prepilin-type N-terminal cleavage/methylation domain-containing protein
MYVSKAGFTIVELLIVIVVIAILASISIVSYNGITRRAELASAYTTVKQYKTMFSLILAEGNMPNSNACLGPSSAYPSGCSIGGQNGSSNSSLNTLLANLGMTNPPLMPLANNKYSMYVPAYYSTQHVMLYTLPGQNVSCGVQPVYSQNGSGVWGYYGDNYTGTYSSFGGYTLCAIGLQ